MTSASQSSPAACAVATHDATAAGQAALAAEMRSIDPVQDHERMAALINRYRAALATAAENVIAQNETRISAGQPPIDPTDLHRTLLVGGEAASRLAHAFTGGPEHVHGNVNGFLIDSQTWLTRDTAVPQDGAFAVRVAFPDGRTATMCLTGHYQRPKRHSAIAQWAGPPVAAAMKAKRPTEKQRAVVARWAEHLWQSCATGTYDHNEAIRITTWADVDRALANEWAHAEKVCWIGYGTARLYHDAGFTPAQFDAFYPENGYIVQFRTSPSAATRRMEAAFAATGWTARQLRALLDYADRNGLPRRHITELAPLPHDIAQRALCAGMEPHEIGTLHREGRLDPETLTFMQALA